MKTRNWRHQTYCVFLYVNIKVWINTYYIIPHSKSDKMFSCPVCEYKATNYCSLKKHMIKHPGEKLLKESIFCCINCLYYANTLGKIFHHKMIHVRERMEKRLKEEGRSDDLWQQKLASFMKKILFYKDWRRKEKRNRNSILENII